MKSILNGPFKCWIPEMGETEEDAIEVITYHPDADVNTCYSIQDVAELAAEQDFHEHDGWEKREAVYTWRVKDTEGNVWDVDVERTSNPQFEGFNVKEVK